MDIKEINKLIDKINEKGITDFKMEKDDFKITIRKRVHEVVRTEAVQVHDSSAAVSASVAAAASVEAVIEEEDNNHKVLSPMVGTYYSAPAPGAKVFVNVGDRVSKGQVLCIVEAMKIMNEIQSDADGVIVKSFAKNEQPVEFDEPLFSIDEG